MTNQVMTCEAVKCYSLVVNERGEITGERANGASADVEADIDRLIREYRFEHPQYTYAEALDAVRERHPRLFQQYSESARPGANARRYSADSETAMQRIDKKARSLMEKDNKLSYSDAVTRVLAENLDLRRAYNATK